MTEEANQPSLFDLPPLIHKRARSTEVTAALRMNLPSLRFQVLAELVRAQGIGRTDVELEYILGVKRPSGGNRRHELMKEGLCKDSGAKRPTESGNPATVWIITGKGKDTYREELAKLRKEAREGMKS